METASIISFEALIAELINIGADDRKVAIAWLQDSYFGYEGDLGFMEYDLGLPRDYLKQ